MSCSDDKKVILYDLKAKNLYREIVSPENKAITYVLGSFSKGWVFFAGTSLYKYEMKSGKIVQKQETIHSDKYCRSMCFFKDLQLVTGGESGYVRVWDVLTLQNLQNIFSEKSVLSLCVLNDTIVMGMKNLIKVK